MAGQGRGISGISWKKAALGGWGLGEPMAGRAAEVEMGEGLGLGCGESGRGGLEPGGSRRRMGHGFWLFRFVFLKLEEVHST